MFFKNSQLTRPCLVPGAALWLWLCPQTQLLLSFLLCPTPPSPSCMQPKAKKAKAVKDTDDDGKKKKKKDPNAPKKNLSAFMFFSNANRDKVKQDNPGELLAPSRRSNWCDEHSF